MEIPQATLDRFKIASELTTGAVNLLSERSLILKDILDTINQERINTKYKQLTGAFIAIKTAHIKTSDLYYIKSVGLDYKKRHGSFSKYFFGAMKLKK